MAMAQVQDTRVSLRKSQRELRPTEASFQYRAEQAKKSEQMFTKTYNSFKIHLVNVRDNLKRDCSEEELFGLLEGLEKDHERVVDAYDDLRSHQPMIDNFATYKRRADSATACKSDLLNLLNHRISEVGVKDFVLEFELDQLRTLKKPYAASVYSDISRSIHQSGDNASVVDAEVSLAPNKLVNQISSQPVFQSHEPVQLASSLNPGATAFAMPHHTPVVNPVVKTPGSELNLAVALANAVDRNRLPIPTPKVYTGNPMDFVAFKKSFKTLIENKGISAEEKIYYLMQYVTGDAREAISGCLYGTEEADYQHAWNTLEKRFGHPFKIQEAYREKLEKWPKVGNKDGTALQRYADFLQSCLDATPHIKGLSILDDCKENQKMAAKLPDWAVTRWSRIVADSIESCNYPTFKQFVAFVEREARVTCNPVFSTQAAKGINSSTDPKVHADMRGRPARSLATEQSAQGDKGLKDKKSCPFCKGVHYLPNSSKFAELSIQEKGEFIQKGKRCFGCLRTGHFTKNCKVRHTCQKCQKCHPTVLHDPNREVPSQGKTKPENHARNATSLSTDQGHASTTNVVPVWISTINNPKVERLVYALLDTQSDATFIENTIFDELSTPADNIKLKLSTLLGKEVTVACKRVTGLRIRGYTSAHYVDLPATYTRDFIPLNREHIPTCDTARAWFHLETIASEMPPLLDCSASLLIGYNCPVALTPRQVIVGEDHQPYAIRTDLGWSIVGGSVNDSSNNSSGICNRVSTVEIPPATPRDLLNVLESDFKDNNYGGDASTSQEDIKFLKLLEGSVSKNSEGHLEMSLPFKARPCMPDNHPLAVKRLLHLQRRLDRDPDYKQHYTQFIETMLKAGHAELATEPAKPGECNYIPHHGVYHPKKPDKLRVVFDCSARYQGKSLNDHLLSGPDLTNNLFGVLCRFRKHPIAITCDVEAMFHQFHVARDDRDYLRFLWWEAGDTSKEPHSYRMNVHLFGATSSPGCANFGLKYLSKLHANQYPLAASFLQQDFYVDDGITSIASADQAIELIRESRELCLEGGLHLHKFTSNSRLVLENIPLKERAAEMQKIDLNEVELTTERVLGIQWSAESDLFLFHLQEKEYPATRRGILSTVASIYDPVGFISPFVLEGKAILQELCKRGTSWDDPVPESLLPRWERWKVDMQELRKVQIPRCYKPADFQPIIRVELHHFSDASTNGYGVCSYLRFLSSNNAYCSLVASKARVAPVKVITIPRLELTAAVVAVKLSLRLKEELHMEVDAEYFWCDSKIVLAYLSNDAKRFHVFVANRVQFIRDHTTPQQWHYVSTECNPADHASRGLSASDLLTSNWFTGPKFLWTTEMIQESVKKADLMIGDPEIKAQALHVLTVSSNSLLETFSNYSDWSFITRITARILRLAQNTAGSQTLTVEEINHASLRVIKLVQEVAFKDEWQALMKGQEISRRSKLYRLNPYIADGVMRVGGRLKNSSLSMNQKHPVLLPREGHITQLIISHFHKQVQHQGRGQTLNQIRIQGYWILGGSSAVATFIRSCIHCRRLRRPVEEQKMADLPEDRVEPSPPFSFCGMDCFGPFVTKHIRKEFKRYGLLFTCLCSRAVHIEMIDDMTTDGFIIGLRNFIAIRGTVTQIRSDQGSNFIGASNELKAAMKELDVNRITNFLTQKQCEFVFNAPHSSHAGGVWERQIRSIRNILDSTLSLSYGRLDDASLRCLLYEAMMIVNSRPLTAIDNDPNSETITPNHLVTMKPSMPLPPPGKFVREDIYARKRWRRIQYLMEQFWSRWRKEYLLNLSERQRWAKPRRNAQVGDIVMLTDIEAPRMEWPLAIIIEAAPDNDGLVRLVKARLGNSSLDKHGKPMKEASVLERPIQKVVTILEC